MGILISFLVAAIIWVAFIIHRKDKQNQETDNEPLSQYEKEYDICSKHGKSLNGNIFCDKCLEENNI
jgi:hypothetical protein